MINWWSSLVLEKQIFYAIGIVAIAILVIIPLIYFIWSLKYGEPAGNNPWGAKGLEWTTQSPPTTFNFDVTPIVTEEAYAYAKHEEAHVG